MRHFPRQQTAEDQAEAPREKRRQHREQPHEGRCASAGTWNACDAQDHGIYRRCCSQCITSDNDHRHLHRESDEIPETRSEPLCRLHRRVADTHARDEYDHNGNECQCECVRKPLLKPFRKIEPCGCKPRPDCLFLCLHARDCIKFLLLSPDSLNKVQVRSGGGVLHLWLIKPLKRLCRPRGIRFTCCEIRRSALMRFRLFVRSSQTGEMSSGPGVKPALSSINRIT